MYADDATILIRGNNYEKVVSDAQNVAARAREWCIANQLCLNESKTVEALFSLKIHMFANPESIQYLGICIEPPTLNFHKHMRDLSSRISKNVYLLSQVSRKVTLQVSRNAYFALIHSLISYAIVAWFLRVSTYLLSSEEQFAF